jgi:hypothetical protein
MPENLNYISNLVPAKHWPKNVFYNDTRLSIRYLLFSNRVYDHLFKGFRGRR